MSLRIVARNHKEWLSIVRSFGAGSLSEDIVQDMYLNYNDNYIIGKEPNKAYIWIVLRNLYYYECKQKKEVHEIEHQQVNEQLFESIMSKANEHINNWHWYDKKLFEIYVNEGLSMREIAKGTGISLRSIFSTLKTCKEKLKNELKEDYIQLYEQE